MDARNHSSSSDGDFGHELVDLVMTMHCRRYVKIQMKIHYLLVIADGQHDVPGGDPGLLSSLGHLSSELEKLSSEVLQHSGEVDGSLPLLDVGQLVVA